jgi:hypothetical protein
LIIFPLPKLGEVFFSGSATELTGMASTSEFGKDCETATNVVKRKELRFLINPGCFYNCDPERNLI